MYSFLRSHGFKAFMVAEAPYFLVAFVIANEFYKWRSFGLELVGFMATWYVLSAVGNAAVAYLHPRLAGNTTRS